MNGSRAVTLPSLHGVEDMGSVRGGGAAHIHPPSDRTSAVPAATLVCYDLRSPGVPGEWEAE
jgi:hypothetical protein